MEIIFVLYLVNNDKKKMFVYIWYRYRLKKIDLWLLDYRYESYILRNDYISDPNKPILTLFFTMCIHTIMKLGMNPLH